MISNFSIRFKLLSGKRREVLTDGCFAHGRVADRKPGDSLLAEGGVEDPVGTELLLKTHGAAEDSAKPNILSEDDRRWICLQRN